MAKYLLKVQESLSRLGEWVIEKIPRGDNVQVDTLAGIAASFPVKEVYVQATPTIAESHVCNMSPKECNWAVDIRAYLQTGALLEDPKCAHKIRVQAFHFLRVSHIRNFVEAASIRMDAYQQKAAFLSRLF